MQCLLYASFCFVEQIGDKLVELCTCDVHIEMNGAVCIHRDEGKIDVCGSHAGKLNLCLLCCFFKPLLRHAVVAKVNSVGLFKFLCNIVDKTIVEIIAAETVVAGSCKNFKHAVADFEDGNIERAAAKVVNQDLLVVFLIHTVCKSRRSGFVDDTENIKACNLACVLGCLTLTVGEISRNCNNSISDFFAEISFRILFQLLKNHCGNFLRSIGFAFDGAAVIAAHFTLNAAYGVVGVGDSLTFCNLTHHTLAVFERNNRGSCAGAFGIGDNNGFAAFKDSNTGIGRTKVDTDNL